VIDERYFFLNLGHQADRARWREGELRRDLDSGHFRQADGMHEQKRGYRVDDGGQKSSNIRLKQVSASLFLGFGCFSCARFCRFYDAEECVLSLFRCSAEPGSRGAQAMCVSAVDLPTNDPPFGLV
jgi:hypothetical protein